MCAATPVITTLLYVGAKSVAASAKEAAADDDATVGTAATNNGVSGSAMKMTLATPWLSEFAL
jgi:hypothetical protein